MIALHFVGLKVLFFFLNRKYSQPLSLFVFLFFIHGRMLRKIIHIDMDAFFASIEQRDQPALRGKAVAVGGNVNRGVVAAASYEARKFGVHSAMPVRTALKKCPELILVRPNGKAYREASDQIRGIFHRYTDYVEPLSLDEAFLDVTLPKQDLGSATAIARAIKTEIRRETALTASAGVSYNKFLAKIASDFQKPDGLTVIPPQKALAFLEALKIEKFFGVGEVAAQRFHELGIFTGRDLKKISESDLIRWFGKAGSYYFHIVRGVDNREVEPDREAKSVGAEETFETDLTDPETLNMQLIRIADRAWKRIEKAGVRGRTLTLKVKFYNFDTINRGRTFRDPIESKQQFRTEIRALFEKEMPLPYPVRLLGATLSNFLGEEEKPVQSTLKF